MTRKNDLYGMIRLKELRKENERLTAEISKLKAEIAEIRKERENGRG